MRRAKIILMLPLITLFSCQKAPEKVAKEGENVSSASPEPEVAPEWITSEQLIQSDFGRSAYPLRIGAKYRIVGKLRNVSVASDGLPQIQFTAFSARLSQQAAKSASNVDAGSYISLNCVYTKRDDPDSELVLKECDELQPIDTVSAKDYAEQYQGNAFKADERFKDSYIVVFGNVTQRSKLINGQDYIDLEADKDFSSVTAILSPEARAMSDENAKIGDMAVMLCVGGYRYNEAGSIGLNDCKYLQNY